MSPPAMTYDMTCPRCGGETLARQTVDETAVVGADAVQVTVGADVCSFCGERWFGPAETATMDIAIARLRADDFSHLKPIGELYHV